MNGRKSQITSLKFLKNRFYISVIFSVFFIFSCEERVPFYNLDISPVEFHDIDSSSISIIDTSIQYTSNFSDSPLLFVGDNDKFSSFILLKFGGYLENIERDSIISMNITLISSVLTSDTLNKDSVGIKLFLITDKTEDLWREDSSNITNFDLKKVERKFLGSYYVNFDDTLVIDIPDTLYTYWRDENNNGLAIIWDNANSHDFIAFHSQEYGDDTPILYISYIDNGDTLEYSHKCYADLSIINFKNTEFPADNILVSCGYGYKSFFNVVIPKDSFKTTDVVAKAELVLHVDKNYSYFYNNPIVLYYSYIDTSAWLDISYSPSSINRYSVAIYPTDKVVTLDISKSLQSAISSGDQLRMVFWPSSYYTPDISIVSFYGYKCDELMKRPVSRIVLMREK